MSAKHSEPVAVEYLLGARQACELKEKKSKKTKSKN